MDLKFAKASKNFQGRHFSPNSWGGTFSKATFSQLPCVKISSKSDKNWTRESDSKFSRSHLTFVCSARAVHDEAHRSLVLDCRRAESAMRRTCAALHTTHKCKLLAILKTSNRSHAFNFCRIWTKFWHKVAGWKLPLDMCLPTNFD